MTSWRDRLPAPLAAPETPALRSLRLQFAGGLGALVLICLFFVPLRFYAGAFALAALASAATFSLLQGWQWFRLKTAADDAWLMRERGDDA